MACFDPSNFDNLLVSGIPPNSLDGMMKFLPETNVDDIKRELLSFATNFDTLKLSMHLCPALTTAASEDDLDHNGFELCANDPCRKCSNCILRILANYRLNDRTYDNLYYIYKIICTISVTQVECERSFSKLKLIKTRLRSSMTNEHMES